MIVGASEGDGASRHVELLEIPPGTAVGEQIFVEGTEGKKRKWQPDTELDFQQFLGTFGAHLFTDGALRACYNHKPLVTSKGYIKSTTIKYGQVA